MRRKGSADATHRRTDAIDMYYAEYAECEDLYPTSPSVEKDDLKISPSEPDSMYTMVGKGKKRSKKGKNKKLGAK